MYVLSFVHSPSFVLSHTCVTYTSPHVHNDTFMDLIYNASCMDVSYYNWATAKMQRASAVIHSLDQ